MAETLKALSTRRLRRPDAFRDAARGFARLVLDLLFRGADFFLTAMLLKSYNQSSLNEERRTMDKFMQAALDEARAGADEGGIPIGSVLVYQGRIIGRGHNRRMQQG